MGNSLCIGRRPAVKPAQPCKTVSRSGSGTSRSSGASKPVLGISTSLGRLSAALKRRGSLARSKAAVANSRLQLEERLAEAIIVSSTC